MSGDSVPTDAVLDCLRQIMTARPRGAALLVPVVLAERARWTPLVRQAFEQDGALVVDATECGLGVPCGNLAAEAPELQQAVTDLLDRYNTAKSGADLRLVVHAGRARVDGPVAYDTANNGQQALRQIATAVCHEDLRAADTVVLITAEEALEAAHVAQAWELLMELPRLLALPPTARLALFAGDGSSNLGGPHYAGEPSVRHIVDRGGLQTRRTWAQNRGAVAELEAHTRADMPLLPLFLGAGVSTSVGLPLGNALRDQALEHLLRGPVTPDTADEAAGRLYDQLLEREDLSHGEETAGRDAFVTSLTLERVLAVEQAREGQTDSTTVRGFRDTHAAVRHALKARAAAGAFAGDPLVRILSRQQRLVLVTVNFDQVIETKGDGLVEPFVTDHDFQRLPDRLDAYAEHGGPVPLIKMHGDIDDAGTIVANLDQTQAGLSLARTRALDALVQRVSRQNVRYWWYVGYSMRDRDLDTVWTNSSFIDTMTERWVAPTVDPTVRAFIDKQRRLRWTGARRRYTADERTVTTTAHDYFGLLDELVVSKW